MKSADFGLGRIGDLAGILGEDDIALLTTNRGELSYSSSRRQRPHVVTARYPLA